MPVYTLNTMSNNCTSSKNDSFVKALTTLHAQTFRSDPSAVRVEFVLAPAENTRFRFGGYGYQPPKGMFGYDKTTAHMVAQVAWRGSREEWQEYCRKIVKLWGRDLRTIVLQRTEWEFEVEEEGLVGWVVGSEEGKA